MVDTLVLSDGMDVVDGAPEGSGLLGFVNTLSVCGISSSLIHFSDILQAVVK